METDDAAVVLAIYQKGLLIGDASFESDAPEWKGWDDAHWMHAELLPKTTRVCLAGQHFPRFPPVASMAGWRK